MNRISQATLLPGKLCNVYRADYLNYILNEAEGKLKNLKFVHIMLQRNKMQRFFDDRIWIIKTFQTYCKLVKCMIRDMLFCT